MIKEKDMEILGVVRCAETGVDIVSVGDGTPNNQLFMDPQVTIAMGLQKGRKVTAYYNKNIIVGINIPGEKVAFIMPIGADNEYSA